MVGARSGVDVVVQLEEADAEVFDQPVEDRVEVRTGGRVAQVQEVSLVLDDPPAVALQERGIRQRLRDRAAHADHLGLQPESDLHAGVPDCGR